MQIHDRLRIEMHANLEIASTWTHAIRLLSNHQPEAHDRAGAATEDPGKSVKPSFLYTGASSLS